MNSILLYLSCGILIYLIMRKHINNYIANHFQNNETMAYKLSKYEYFLSNLHSVNYYFNTYGKPIPYKYQKLIDIINIRKASDDEYYNIRKQGDLLAKDDHSARLKFNIGSFNTIFTIFILTNDVVDSVINFIISDNNTCYIETIVGFNNNILVNKLKEICKKMGLTSISTFSIYQPETDFLIKNGFVLDNRMLTYYV